MQNIKSPLLGPSWADTFLSNASSCGVEKGAFHEHTNIALILVIHKKGKNPQGFINYILINAKMKLNSKLLPILLEKYMGDLFTLVRPVL